MNAACPILGSLKIAYWRCKKLVYMKWTQLVQFWGVSKIAYWRCKNLVYMKWKYLVQFWGVTFGGRSISLAWDFFL